MANQVTFEFPSEEALNVFLGWMSDGGGESGASESCRHPLHGYQGEHGDSMSFNYDKCFPAWGYDPEKHGERKVVVTVEKEEKGGPMAHFIEICSVCDSVISQCRCMACDKTERTGLCQKCVEAGEETRDQYEIRRANTLTSIKRTEAKDLSLALVALADIGLEPSLIYDDNGMWACGGTSFGNAISERGCTFNISYIVNGDDFRDTPREAVMVFVDMLIAMERSDT